MTLDEQECGFIGSIDHRTTSATIRLRTSADVVLWSGVLVAGQTQIVEDIDISLAAGVKVQFSVEPASGTLTLDHQECGFIRSIP